jgi:hypothetical protein
MLVFRLQLFFTGGSYQIRAWHFPFDATRGQVAGPGQAVTSPGVEAWMPSLSRDGKKLIFRGIRVGKWNVWETSLSDGHEAPIIADDYQRESPGGRPTARVSRIRETTRPRGLGK